MVSLGITLVTPRVRDEDETNGNFSKPHAVAKYGATVARPDMLSTDARHREAGN